MRKKRHRITAEKLHKLRALLSGADTMAIVMQDSPDPDAIAAAAGLRFLANSLYQCACSLFYSGRMGRSENEAMVRYLGLNLREASAADFETFDLTALVDTQPQTGNNSLPESCTPDIVIDHHPIRPLTRRATFTDIRSRYGATASIIYEYIAEARLHPSAQLATALVYGIRSDTQDLGRETTSADIEAYLALYPRANKRMLSRIEHAPVPKNYFQMLTRALRNARLCGPCLTVGLGRVDHPDMISEVADLLLRHQDTAWVLCYGEFESRLLLSLRTTDTQADSGQIMRRVAGRRGTGGGHRTLAGGQIPISGLSREEIARQEKDLVTRFLQQVGAGKCVPELFLS